MTKSNYLHAVTLLCVFFCSKKVSLPTREESIQYSLMGIFKCATVDFTSASTSAGDYYYTQSNVLSTVHIILHGGENCMFRYNILCIIFIIILNWDYYKLL